MVDKKSLEEVAKKPPTDGTERIEGTTKSTENRSGKQDGREPNLVIATADKGPKPQDSEPVRDEGMTNREKVVTVKDDPKKTSDITKEKEEGRPKLADFILPEFTRVMVTKLSRNVTQVRESLVIFSQYQ